MDNAAEVGEGAVLLELILDFTGGGGPRLYRIMKAMQFIGEDEEKRRGGCASPGSLFISE